MSRSYTCERWYRALMAQRKHSTDMKTSQSFRLSSLAALVAAAWMAAAGSSSGAQFQVFLDRGAWEEAVSGVVFTESFDSQPVPPRFQLAPGRNQIGLLNIEVQQFSGNLIAEGSFYGTVNGTPFWRIEAMVQNGSTSPIQPIVWFDQPVQAFGADFNFSFAPRATLSFNDQVLLIDDYIPGERNGFFGVTSTVPFDHVQFDVINPVNTIFHADNVSFAVVPEPSAFAMLLAGAGGLAVSKRRARGARQAGGTSEGKR